jgi:hypothetical protein
MHSRDVAASLAALLLVYHQATTWLPLFPWNDIGKYTRKELVLEAAFNGLLMGAGLACLLVRNSGAKFRFYSDSPRFVGKPEAIRATAQ